MFSGVENLNEFKCSSNILMYHSLQDEFPTTDTINRWAGHKNIYLPKVIGDDLMLLKYEPRFMHTGAYGIAEPDGTDRILPTQIDLIIVPAMAFDTQGNRLGRGKGYYDRLLAKTNAVTIGIGYDFQLLDSIPAAPHDRKMNYIFTPSYSIHL